MKHVTLRNRHQEFEDLIWKRQALLSRFIETDRFNGEEWGRDIISSNPNFIRNKNLLKTLGPRLKDLNLANCNEIDQYLFLKFGFRTPNLERVNLRGLAIQNQFLDHMAESLNSLQAIDIGNCSGITEEGLARFFHTLKRPLKHLGLSGLRTSVTSRSLAALDLSQLVFLDISLCDAICNRFFQRFEASSRFPLKTINLAFVSSTLTCKDLNQFFRNCPSLNSIDLEGILLTSASPPKSIFVPLDCAFNLKSLNFSNIRTEQAFALSCTGVKWLSVQSLFLKNFRPLDHASLEQLVRKCPNLEVLDISHNPQLQTEQLEGLLSNLVNCRKIQMEHTPGISRKDLDNLRKVYPDILFLRQLLHKRKAKDSGLRVPIPTKKADWPNLKKGKKK